MSDYKINPGWTGPRSPVKHSMKRRSSCIDYRDPRIYMFTMRKNPIMPDFSTITGDPHYLSDHPSGLGTKIILSPLGEIIKSKILAFPDFVPHAETYRFVIMPDHIHWLLRVRQRLLKPITSHIAASMGACTTAFALPAISPGKRFEPVFEPGINDRHLSKAGQLNTLKDYIADNPRRRLIKRLYPDFFQRNIRIILNSESYDAFGNAFLLKRDWLKPVHVRRRFTQAETESYIKECLVAVANGAVLISPFIHPAEKEIKSKALEMGGSVIRVSLSGFGKLFSPYKSEFELCRQGRLLLIARSNSPLRDIECRKSYADILNRFAETISDMDRSERGHLLI